MAAQGKFDFKKALATQSKNRQVSALQIQLAGQRAKLAAQGGSVPTSHPGVFSRILDLVSRGNYAMAGMFGHSYDELAKHGGKGSNISTPEMFKDMAVGFGRGLAGKDKYHFSDVMQKAVEAKAPGSSIEKNRVVRGAGGLLADIVTDPLTYISGGFTKAIPAVEELGVAAKSIEAAKGAKATPDILNAVADTARAGAKAGQKGKIGVEILGKPFESEKLYEGLAKVGRPIAATPPVDWANKALRTTAQYPGRLKSMMRVPQAVGIHEYTEFDKSVMKQFGHLSREEAGAVSHAIEQGLGYGPNSILAGRTGGRGRVNLQEVADYWLQHKRQMEQVEADLGIKKIGQGMDTHIPKKFPSHAEYESDKAARFRQTEFNVSNNLKQGAKKPGSMPTLVDLKKAGLHPHENILDIMRLRTAEHYRAVARAQFKMDAIDALGIQLKGAGKKAARTAAEDQGLIEVPNKLLKNTLYEGKTVHAPEDLVRSFKTLDELYKKNEEMTRFVRTIDGMTRVWKSSVTTMSPAHHIRNMIGDAFLNFEAGVKNPMDYTRAGKVLTRKGQIKIGNKMFDSADIYNLYTRHGGASGFFNTEVLGATTPGAITEGITRPLNRGLEFTREKVAQREDFMRLANFTNALRENGSHVKSLEDLDKVAGKAIDRVKKFNFDYGDFTNFESSVRRFIPFYSFMRKNIPLQLEMMALHPDKIARVPQGFNALQQLLGTDPQHLPITEVIPSYLKDLSTVRLQGENDEHSLLSRFLGTGKNAVYGGLPVPLEDFSKFSGSGPEVALNMLAMTHPLPKALAEYGFQRSALSGASQPKSLGRYVLDQAPQTRLLANLVSPKEPNRILQPGEKSGPNNKLALINLLSGGGFKELTPSAQRGELRRQQDPVQARLRAARRRQVNKARSRHGS